MFEPYKHALDEEFRRQRHDALALLELPVGERAEASRCVADLLYQGVDGRRVAHHVFHYGGANGRFRAGDYVFVTPRDPEPRSTRVLEGTAGIIDAVEAHRLIVNVHRSELGTPFMPGRPYVLDERPPTWAPNFQRLSLALALAEWGPGQERLRELLAGTLDVQRDDEPSLEAPDDLAGERARLAYRRAVTGRLTAVQGPPGTGKTHLLARVARECLRQGLRVVLVCFTHRAINNALGAMVSAGVSPESLGKVPGSDESDLPTGVVTLDKREYWKRPREGFVAAMTAHAAFEPFAAALGAQERRMSERRPARDQADDAAFWAALDRFQRGLVRAAALPAPERLADVVIFDEAGQITVPMALCALAVAPRAVFFGDHAQLPPVGEPHAGYPSIFHLVAERYPAAFVRLNASYRMNAALCAFPAGAFYEDDLAPAPVAEARVFPEVAAEPMYAPVLASAPASVFVAVRHTGEGQVSAAEAALTADLALVLLLSGKADAKTGLAVLAPHRRQVNAIRTAFEALARRRGVSRAQTERWLGEVVVDTVDRMQGQERDVVLYSLTASDDGVLEDQREFLFLPNRFNVAITRARTKLIVIGSNRFFHHLPHGLLHAGWQGEAGGETRRMLADANVFKRWYLAHRDSAVDLTSRAEELAGYVRQAQ